MQFDFRKFFEELTAEERQRIDDAISSGQSGMTADEITAYYRGYADYIREHCREIIRRRDAPTRCRYPAQGSCTGSRAPTRCR